MAKRKRYIIVGLGGFGSTIARTLFESNHEVIAIDRKEELVQEIAFATTRAVSGDGTKREVLKAIGVDGADGAVVSTGEDISASILAAMALLDLGVKEIHVKVISHEHARILGHFPGITSIFPEHETARNLARQMERTGSLLNYFELGRDLSLQEMAVPVKWEGKSLAELQLRSTWGISVVAVHDVVSDSLNPIPDPSMPLLDTHTLIVTGSPKNLTRVADIP